MRIGIALGSNLGSRRENLARASRALLEIPGLSEPALRSRIWETKPVACPPGSPSFYNAVIELECDGRQSPEELLDALKAVERSMGRDSSAPRNSPRIIDCDLLYLGGLSHHSQRLEIPHPRLAERRFVLGPLADIRPGLVLPGTTATVAVLLGNLPSDGAAPTDLAWL